MNMNSTQTATWTSEHLNPKLLLRFNFRFKSKAGSFLGTFKAVNVKSAAGCLLVALQL